MEVIQTVSAFLAAHKEEIGIFLGFLFGVLKRVPNDKASPVIAKAQAGLDKIASLVVAVGGFLQEVSLLLSDAIKSNGILGK